MALNNYANLKAAIESWSKRTDITNVLDDFIDLAESKINADLALASNETRSTAVMTPGDRFLALPNDFLQMRRLTLSGNRPTELQYLSPESMEIASQSGRPIYFTVTSQLEFNRAPDSDYTVEMSYIAQLTALSDNNTSNNVLTKYPDLYLYGCLAACHRWARDEQTAVYYDGMFEQCMIKAKRQEMKGSYGPAPAMRKEGRTP